MSEFSTVGEVEIFAKGIKEHISTELKNIALDMHQGFEDIGKKQDYTNGRLRRLELWRSAIVGALMALNTIVYPIVLIYLQKHL